MVVQKTIDNLKERPQDERKVVAGGIAVTVVAVLLIGWAIMFFRGITNGTQDVNFDSGAQEEFNFSSVREAQSQIEAQQGGYSSEDLERLRDDAASLQLQNTQSYQIDDEGDHFAPPAIE